MKQKLFYVAMLHSIMYAPSNNQQSQILMNAVQVTQALVNISTNESLISNPSGSTSAKSSGSPYVLMQLAESMEYIDSTHITPSGPCVFTPALEPVSYQAERKITQRNYVVNNKQYPMPYSLPELSSVTIKLYDENAKDGSINLAFSSNDLKLFIDKYNNDPDGLLLTINYRTFGDNPTQEKVLQQLQNINLSQLNWKDLVDTIVKSKNNTLGLCTIEFKLMDDAIVSSAALLVQGFPQYADIIFNNGQAIIEKFDITHESAISLLKSGFSATNNVLSSNITLVPNKNITGNTNFLGSNATNLLYPFPFSSNTKKIANGWMVLNPSSNEEELKNLLPLSKLEFINLGFTNAETNKYLTIVFDQSILSNSQLAEALTPGDDGIYLKFNGMIDAKDDTTLHLRVDLTDSFDNVYAQAITSVKGRLDSVNIGLNKNDTLTQLKQNQAYMNNVPLSENAPTVYIQLGALPTGSNGSSN